MEKKIALNIVRDCQQITSVMLNGFCVLGNPPVLNEQYHNGQNTNQNQKKNTCRFCTVFQVLELLLIKICKIQLLDILFIVAFPSFYISRYRFTQIFKTSLSSIISEKDFHHKFSFFNGLSNPLTQLTAKIC